MKRILTASLLLLASIAGALAQSAPANLPYHTVYGRLGAIPGDTGPGQAIPFSTLATQLGTAGIPSVTIESQHGGCNVADNTAALLAAANSVAGAVRVTFPNNCTYRFTQANAIVFSKAVFLQGTAPAAAVLAYNPSAAGVFLNWSNGLSVLYGAGGAGFDNLTLISSDTTHSKVMASFSDVSGFRATNSTIGWPYGSVVGGVGSVCLQTQGRETSVFDNLTLACDRPLRISMNPNSPGTDHFHFSNLYLLAAGPYPNITVDPGVVFSNTTFDGYQAWALGQDGFHYVDTAAAHQVASVNTAGSGYTAGQIVPLSGGTCTTPISIRVLTINGSGGITSASIAEPGVCSVVAANPKSLTTGGATVTTQLVAGFRLSFENVRSEQGTGGAATYTFNIQAAASIQALTISNSIMDSHRCGYLFKNIWFATIRETTYLTDGGLTCAGSATSANGNDALSYVNNFWLAGATHDETGLTATYKVGGSTSTSTTVPSSAFYTLLPLTESFYDVAVTNNVSATTFDNVAITVPASTARLTMGAGKTATFSNTMTQTATDGAAIDFGAGGTVAYTGGGAALTRANDTNVTLTLTGTPATALLQAVTVTAGWTGTLAAARLNSNVVQAITNDTNVTGSISAQNLTLGWTGTLANARLATMATNTVKGNATSGTASPTDLAVSSCSTASSALIWTTNTGFGCNTAITASSATSATSATNATNVGITEDTTTNATVYPTWVTTTTGNLPLKVSSTKVNFNPATGIFSALQFAGSGATLTGTAASLTAGNVTTNANLTGPITSVGNATSVAAQTGTGTTFAMSAGPTFTGVPAAPTAAVDTNTTQLATTAMVLAQAASATPIIDGTAAVGTSTRYARGDHVHPTDTSRAPLASPTFTGVPAAPTAAVDTNTTQLATTAFVIGQAGSVGAWTTFTPTVTCTTGGPPTLAAASTNGSAYQVVGKTMRLRYLIQTTALNGCTGFVQVLIPNSKTSASAVAVSGAEFATSTYGVQGATNAAGQSLFTLGKYDGTIPLDVAVRGFALGGVIEIQ